MGISSDEVISRQITEVFPDESSTEDEASEMEGGLVSWVALAATQGMVCILKLHAFNNFSNIGVYVPLYDCNCA